ncbi:hypothetical protein LJR129_004972 [Acidovorax sp. LjRoot129]|uniref:hypothetical protein n=1 Tax=unclassified Acidovorax TaxID=2684926 RepID=UPI003ED14B76
MQTKYSFPSATDAISIGFVVAQVKRYQVYKGCFINGFDTSGRGAKGYSFGLRVEVPDDFTPNFLGVQSEKIFGQTIAVSVGSYSSAAPKTSTVVMFEPQVFRAALEEARFWVDVWFRAHPEAAALALAAMHAH